MKEKTIGDYIREMYVASQAYKRKLDKAGEPINFDISIMPDMDQVSLYDSGDFLDRRTVVKALKEIVDLLSETEETE